MRLGQAERLKRRRTDPNPNSNTFTHNFNKIISNLQNNMSIGQSGNQYSPSMTFPPTLSYRCLSSYHSTKTLEARAFEALGAFTCRAVWWNQLQDCWWTPGTLQHQFLSKLLHRSSADLSLRREDCRGEQKHGYKSRCEGSEGRYRIIYALMC